MQVFLLKFQDHCYWHQQNNIKVIHFIDKFEVIPKNKVYNTQLTKLFKYSNRMSAIKFTGKVSKNLITNFNNIKEEY